MSNNDNFSTRTNHPQATEIQWLRQELQARPDVTPEELELLKRQTLEYFTPSRFSTVMLYAMIILKLIGVITLIIAVIALIVASLTGGIITTDEGLIFDISHFVVPLTILATSIIVSVTSQLILMGQATGVLYTLGTPFDNWEIKTHEKMIDSIINNRNNA